MLSAAVLAVVIAPILIRWTGLLANRGEEVRGKFLPSPPLRALYPGGLIMFGWGVAYEVNNAWSLHRLEWADLLGFLLAVGFLTMTVVSWPIVVEVRVEGIRWHGLIRRYHAEWKQVEDVNITMNGGLIIYLSGDRRVEVGEYTQGREDLRRMICGHIGKRDEGIAVGGPGL
jgi:hypothetical protein